MLENKRKRRGNTMATCNHDRWLYIPPSLGIGDGYFHIDDKCFLCADCGQWIQFGSIDVEKIVNIKHLPPESCPHDIDYFTIGRYYLCLRCGYRWIRELPKLDIKTDSFNWEEWDKQRRQEALERYKNGEIL